jgi:hypothetical protein
VKLKTPKEYKKLSELNFNIEEISPSTTVIKEELVLEECEA